MMLNSFAPFHPPSPQFRKTPPLRPPRIFRLRACYISLLGVFTLLWVLLPLNTAVADHSVAVLPVSSTTDTPPSVIEEFVVSALKGGGHTAISGSPLKDRLDAGFDVENCTTLACAARVARKVGAGEALVTTLKRQGEQAVLTLKRVSPDGNPMGEESRSMASSTVALLDGTRAAVGDLYAGATTRPDKKSSEDVDEEGVKFRVGINVVPDQQNDNLDDTPVKELVDDTAYAYSFDVRFPSEDKIVLGRFYQEEYISLRITKFVSRGEEADFPEEKYAESLEAIAILYGQRYYLSVSLKWAGFGWYAGGAMINTEGYNFIGKNITEKYTEELFAPLAAFELFVKVPLGPAFIEPQFLLAINTDSGGTDFETLPAVVVGLQF